ncbi:LicD family protein [Clostridium algidicarnis]|uniref:LicD family protein n=1 Tax=Clostridium algidicarnis TaxID=37659 RepID=UPI0004952DCA|nr:LicD family protein [Clostridium algidicarnis]
MELVYKEKLKENIEEGLKTQHKVDFDELFPDKRLENLKETELRQCQLILLRILKIVTYVCEKNSLTYWLDSGTLLGAVRHEGFIPWDDDIDIAMPREDYEKFLKVAKEELPDDLYVQNLDTTEFAGNTWTQIKDRKSKIVLSEDAKYHQGLYIDIFPMDSYSNNFFKRNFVEKIHKLSYIKVQAINAPLKKPILKGMNFPKNIIKILLKIVFFVFAIFDYNKIYEMNIKSKNKRIENIKKNSKTNYGYGTEVLNWDVGFNAEDVLPITKKMKFEDAEFMVPRNTDAILKELYGNYMQIPNVDKQVYHNLSLKSVLTKEEEEELNRRFYY